MNRWAWLVALLYVVIVALLTVPAMAVAFGSTITINAKTVSEIYAEWQYGLLLAVMFVSQYALLRVPVRVRSRRPVTRGALWPTVLAGGLMAGCLVIGICAAIIEGAKTDFGSGILITCLALGVIVWMVWAVVFYRSGRTDASAMVSRQSNLLIKGSVLELLIAVPMHIIVRHRDNCCAGIMTFIGLTAGVSVMLFAFGPAVFFLFVQRWKRLHPEAGEGSV